VLRGDKGQTRIGDAPLSAASSASRHTSSSHRPVNRLQHAGLSRNW